MSGGWNCRDTEENIATNELASVTNMTYADAKGRLRLRRGTGLALHTFSAPIGGMTWYNSKLCIAAGGSLWQWDDSGGGMGEIGALAGSARPSFQEFGGELYIATGGKLQKYDGTTLSTIEDSYSDTVGLFMRDGRLCCWRSSADYADYIYASYVGDPSTWTVPSGERTDADPVEIQIGYKMAGNIVAVMPMLSDLIIFKKDLVMRLVGGLINTEGIYEVARNINVANQWSVANVGGSLFYIDKTKGAQLLEGVDTYGDILPGDTLQKVNPYIRENLDEADCRLWHLKMRNIIVFGIGDERCIPAYYSFGDSIPALKWEFADNIRDIVEPDRERLYIAIGSKLHSLTEEVDDDTDGIAHEWKTKRITGPSFYLLKRVALDAATDVELPSNMPVDVYVNDSKYLEMSFGDSGGTPVYGNTSAVLGNDKPAMLVMQYRNDFTKHQTYRSRTLQFKFTCASCSPYTMSQFRVEIVPVGVIG